jgi:colanic acid/amylovoran biosynthesis glycosyltransferase
LSETFVYTTLRLQTEYRPVVLARRTLNLDTFPFDPVVELTPDAPRRTKAVRTLRAFRHGCISAYELEVARAARRFGCVALHAHHGPSGCFALKARSTLGIPLVTTFYGFDLTLPRDGLALRRRYRRLFDEGTVFVCEGPVMAERLARVGCAREKIRVVPIGIDLAEFPFERRSRGEPLVIMQAARFVPKKGVDLAIRAYAAAREELGPSELWLVGDGPERPALARLVAQLGLERFVRFLGMLAPTEFRGLLGRVHVGVQPSRTAPDGDTEGGAPTVLLEFQAVGIPVVATRHADIPSVVADPETLVEEEDVDGLAAALVQLARTSGADWRDRVARGREFIERRHDAGRVAKTLSAVYAEALAGCFSEQSPAQPTPENL